MLKIRLRRMGSRHRPFYRFVVSDSRRAPTASAVEEIGHYDPRRKPAALSLNLERAEHWLSQGAQPSKTVANLIGRARSLPPEADTATTEAAPAEEAPAEAAAPAKKSAKKPAKKAAAEEEAPSKAAEKEAPSKAAEEEAPSKAAEA